MVNSNKNILERVKKKNGDWDILRDIHLGLKNCRWLIPNQKSKD